MARGLVPTRQQAQDAIVTGRVLVAGAVATKATRLVAGADPVLLCGPPPRFVSRGGEKLDAALDRFGVEVAGGRALDGGASTGGFTDCLLQRGAAPVVSVDVGHGQLHERIRSDSRVLVLERTNLRTLGLPGAGGVAFPVVVADLSFISLRTVATVLLQKLAAPGADVVVLVKPQFEVGRAEASRGRGVIKDPELWRSALAGVMEAFAGCGAAMMGTMASPLTGASGNVELLLHCRAGTNGPRDLDLGPVLVEAQAVAAGAGGGGTGDAPGNCAGFGQVLPAGSRTVPLTPPPRRA